MWKVAVVKDKETPTSWVFEVTVSVGPKNDRIYNYDVEVEKEYYNRLTNGAMPPVSLIQHSFLFLLGKESPEDISESFNLVEISKYFSGYEKAMANLL